MHGGALEELGELVLHERAVAVGGGEGVVDVAELLLRAAVRGGRVAEALLDAEELALHTALAVPDVE